MFKCVRGWDNRRTKCTYTHKHVYGLLLSSRKFFTYLPQTRMDSGVLLWSLVIDLFLCEFLFSRYILYTHNTCILQQRTEPSKNRLQDSHRAYVAIIILLLLLSSMYRVHTYVWYFFYHPLKWQTSVRYI
jgi:hypothetical protein